MAAVDPILRNVKPPIFLSLKTHRLKFGSRAPEVVAMRTFSVSPRRVVLHARVRFVGDDLQAVIVAGMPTGRVFAGARHSHPLGRGESGLMRCGVRGRYMVSGRSCWAHHDLRGSADWEQVCHAVMVWLPDVCIDLRRRRRAGSTRGTCAGTAGTGGAESASTCSAPAQAASMALQHQPCCMHLQATVRCSWPRADSSLPQLLTSQTT